LSKINNTVIYRLTGTSSTMNSTPTIGYLTCPEEGIIRRIRVKAVNNLSSFVFSLAEEDVFTGSTEDGEHLVASWKVNEPNESAKADSTTYLLDEASNDLYFKLKDSISGKSRHMKKLYYMMKTDSASNSTVTIKIDVEVAE